MFARKAYFRLLIAIIIYSSNVISTLPFFSGAALSFLTNLLLLVWAVYPIMIGNKATIVRPFQSDLGAQSLLSLFIIWQIFVVIRGFLFNYGLSLGSLGQIYNPYGIYALLLPLIVYLNPKQIEFKQLVSVLTIMGVVLIVYIWVNRGFLFSADLYDKTTYLTEDIKEQKGVWMSSVQYTTKLFQMAGFLMFVPLFISKRRYLFVLVCWGLALLCAVMGGRRGSSVTLILMALASFYFYVHKGKRTALWLKLVLILFLILAIAYYVYSTYTSMFSIMADRIDADSRTELFVAFWADMGQGFDWIWGRGLGGQYYYPIVQNNGELILYRNAAESGYLHIILSGGIISLILYISVLLSAIRKGFFHTRNQLTKAFAAYIGVSLFNLIPFGLPECSVTFFVIWLGVAICSSPYYRNMTDNEIKQLFS